MIVSIAVSIVGLRSLEPGLSNCHVSSGARSVGQVVLLLLRRPLYSLREREKKTESTIGSHLKVQFAVVSLGLRWLQTLRVEDLTSQCEIEVVILGLDLIASLDSQLLTCWLGVLRFGFTNSQRMSL